MAVEKHSSQVCSSGGVVQWQRLGRRACDAPGPVCQGMGAFYRLADAFLESFRWLRLLHQESGAKAMIRAVNWRS